jgi:hypothetical protein
LACSSSNEQEETLNKISDYEKQVEGKLQLYGTLVSENE